MKLLRDNLHGDISINPLSDRVIKHPLFQRLRFISQTGFLYLIYPGMRHSRFEHSIGACHLADRFLNALPHSSGILDNLDPVEDHLLIEESKDLIKTILRDERWKDIFRLAALLHDLGHGPFSHTFEQLDLLKPEQIDFAKVGNEAIKKFLQAKTRLKHEDMSLYFLDQILSPEKDTVNDTLWVACLIHSEFRESICRQNQSGHKDSQEAKIVLLLSPMISGLVDVDRLDYVVRDAKMAGVPYGQIEVARIIDHTVPVLLKDHSLHEGALLVRAKYSPTIDHFLFNLFEMYPHIYYHQTAIRMAHEFKQTIEISRRLPGLICENWYKNASDHSLLNDVEPEVSRLISDVFSRRCKSSQRVAIQLLKPSDGLINDLKEKNWIQIEAGKRNLLKGKDKVFLKVDTGDKNSEIVPWSSYSILQEETYKPQIWWHNPGFTEALESVRRSLESNRKTKKDKLTKVDQAG